MTQHTDVFETPPNMLASYARALVMRRKPWRAGQTVPHLEATLAPRRPHPGHVRHFRRVAELPDVPELPVTYPQLMAAPLHLHLLTHPDFPFAPMGIVHVRNVIEQFMPLSTEHALAIKCFLEGHRDVPLGVELDLVTEARTGGQRAWRGVTTMRRRGKQKADGAKPRHEQPAELLVDRTALFTVSEGTGRRHAAVSGDVNPIHIAAWTAKLFGFPRAIAHGMWSLSRCMGLLARDLPPPPLRVEVTFKRPVLLPSEVEFAMRREGDVRRFWLRSADGKTVHLEGEARPISL